MLNQILEYKWTIVAVVVALIGAYYLYQNYWNTN